MTNLSAEKRSPYIKLSAQIFNTNKINLSFKGPLYEITKEIKNSMIPTDVANHIASFLDGRKRRPSSKKRRPSSKKRRPSSKKRKRNSRKRKPSSKKRKRNSRK
jgi:hypothetical protein